MNREVHVRFCESVGVGLPHATRLFVERLWRTVKYEDIYIKGYATVAELEAGLADYFWFYNHERPHQALGYQTPAEVYLGKIEAESVSVGTRQGALV
jgi:transposase InsO family protein